MNVMKKAHELVKTKIAQWADSGVNLRESFSYVQLLSMALKQAHKEYKQMNAEKQMAVKHFEDAITQTLEHFEKLGVNDYYIAVENNAQLNDYTILAHKVVGDTSSALGWSNYAGALITNGKQADEYVKSYPGVVKLHAQTYLSKVLDVFRDNLEKIQK